MSQPLPRPENELDDLYAGAPKDDNAIRQVQWLRASIAQTAFDDAVIAALGAPDNPPYAEVMVLATSMANHLGWPANIANAAFKAQWAEATKKVQECQEAVSKAVWPLAKIRADDEAIFAAAQKACDKTGVFVPTDMLVDLCRKVVGAAVKKHVGRR